MHFHAADWTEGQHVLTGTVIDVCDTELTSDGVLDSIELAPEVVRDRFRERGIPPLATISSTSPLVCCRTPIACWCDTPLSSCLPSIARI